MSKEPEVPDIRNEYAQKVAADLETNARNQEEIRSQIAAQQTLLEHLIAEGEWLSGMQATLAAAPATPQPSADAPGANGQSTAVPAATAEAVPRPRQARKTRSGTVPKKSAQTKLQGTAKTAKPAKRAQPGGKKDGPPWRVFVMEVLQDGKPRTAREIADEITEAHSDRTPDEKVVRNTVNALIAKRDVGREKQGNTVYYTAIQQADESTADTSAALPEQVSAEPVPVDA